MTGIEGGANGSTSASLLGDRYDQIPYVSMPIEASQPVCLGAIAQMHGLTLAGPDRARVLELGCASGGNIVPLAARFPAATFTGVDLAAAHVASAHSRIAALGLKNIVIRQGDLATIDLKDQTFDTIICHGVFSWVPPATQDAILRICSRHLSAHGVVFLSFNVLPGWHQRNIVRDICLEHSKSETSPVARVAKAREILSELAKSVSTTTPYGVMLHNEVANLKTLPASYLLGEFLVAENHACTLGQFAARVKAFGLSYLSECDLASSLPETVLPSAAATIRRLAGPDPISVQNYTDIFSGRTFRRALLVRNEQSDAVKPANARQLSGLHLSCALRKSGRAAEVGFYDRFKRLVAAKDAATLDALTLLSQRYPSTVPFDGLSALATTAKSRNDLIAAIYKLVSDGAATVYALPLRCGSAQAKQPEVWPLARLEAQSGQNWVTSLHHRSIPLNKILLYLVPRVDGTTDHSTLLSNLASALASEDLSLPTDFKRTATVAGDNAHKAIAADYLKRGLEYLAVNALLLPEKSGHGKSAVV